MNLPTEYRYAKFLEIRYQEKCDELRAAHDHITYLRKKIEELEATNNKDAVEDE